MNIAAARMQPLPVRPVDGRSAVAAAPGRAAQPATMHPLPVTRPLRASGSAAAESALAGVAFERMLSRLGIANPFPVADPTA